MARTLNRVAIILSIVAMIGSTIGVEGQDRPRRGNRGGFNRPPEQAPEPAAQPEVEKKPAEPDRFLAVTGARVHTVSGGTLEGVTVLCKNGRIAEIGPAIMIPEGAEVLDASGLDLYPGLVAVATQGVLGGGAPDDSTDVFALNLTTALAGGITTGVTGNTAAKLTFGNVEDMVLNRSVFESFNFSTRSPNARRTTREGLERVRAYLRDLAIYEQEKDRDPNAKAPDNRFLQGQFATYLKLIKGEATAVVDANSAHELIQICDLAEDFGIRFVVRGAIEGWTVADRLARARVGAILTPRARQDLNKDLIRENGSSIENASILASHGVPVAFIPIGSLFGPGSAISFGGLGGRDLLHLNMEAAFAVRGGMSNDDAVRALTLDAARILGVDRRVGSIEVGKDADFCIADGDIMHYMTLVRWTVVNGRVAYDKQKDTLLDHIRPGGDRNAPPPEDYWPRRLGAEW